MKNPLILFVVLFLVGSQGLAQDKRASLFSGPSYNYYCTPDQEIMAMRQVLLNRQRSQLTTAEQNMARYLELEKNNELGLRMN